MAQRGIHYFQIKIIYENSTLIALSLKQQSLSGGLKFKY